MAGGFNFSIDFDSSAFKRGSDQAADSLDQLGDALDDIGRADTTSAERGVEDLGTQANRTADDVDRLRDSTRDLDRTDLSGARGELEQTGESASSTADQFRESFDRARKDVRTSTQQIGEDADAAARGVKESFQDNQVTPEDIFRESLRAELVSNMSETGAEVVRGFKDGFDSEDLETVVDGVTDTMVSIGALGGPAGAAAGIAGGALVQAFAGPFIEESKRRAEEFETIYAEAFDAIVENGAEMGRELAIQSRTDEIVQDQERLAEAQRIAKATGADLAVVVRGLAGDQSALELVQKQAAERQAELRQRVQETTSANNSQSESIVGWNAKQREAVTESSALTQSLETLRESNTNATSAINGATAAAQAKAEVDAYAASKAIEHARATAKETGEQQDLEVQLDGVSTAIRVMPNGKVVKVTDEGTAKLTQDEIDEITGKDVVVKAHADTSSVWSALDSLTGTIHTVYVELQRRGGFYP